MKLQLLVELIHNLNECFIHYEIHVAIVTLSHYLFNLMFIGLEDCFIFIGPFIDTLSIV
jgi:hypothetical protein